MGATDPCCKVCKEPINPGASKCNACGSYQGWLQRFIAGMDIQALITLIPVATLALVFIKDHFITPTAELHLLPLSCREDSLRIAAANIGTHSALITSLSLIDKQQNPLPLTFTKESQNNLLVEAGKMKVFELNALDESGNAMGLKLSPVAPCRFRLKSLSRTFKQHNARSQILCACQLN